MTEWNGSGPPAFQFYARDWLMSTRTLSPEARGIYIDLLCLAWDQDGLPQDPSTLLPHLAITTARWKRIWAEVESKFVEAEEGRLRNPRQERHRAELRQFAEQKAKAGRKGAKARWEK